MGLSMLEFTGYRMSATDELLDRRWTHDVALRLRARGVVT